VTEQAEVAGATAREWIEAFACELGAPPPDPESVDAVLELAAIAAHASERIAAPVACWLGGASGKSIDELRAIAARVSG